MKRERERCEYLGDLQPLKRSIINEQMRGYMHTAKSVCGCVYVNMSLSVLKNLRMCVCGPHAPLSCLFCQCAVMCV